MKTNEPEVTEPVTYYEAFTGKRDPNRDFFIAARRLLNVLSWIIALIPFVVLVAIGVLNGESFETIALMGFFGAAMGLIFKKSLPRSPFG